MVNFNPGATTAYPFCRMGLSLKITVHRINLVEPDGTPGLILAGQAAIPEPLLQRESLPNRTAAGMQACSS